MSTPSTTSNDFLSILRAERRDLLNRLRETRFSTLKEGYPHVQLISHASYAPWLADDAFEQAYQVAREFTMVDLYRCYELYQLARQVAAVPGDIVEVGVWRGGTAALLAVAAPEKSVSLFDTFSGVAKSDARYDTLYQGGEHADSDRAIVQGLFDRLQRPCSIHQGIFPDDTLAGLPARISMAHIDVDTHGSARASFEEIWPRLEIGGVVVFDDYGFFGCEGVTQFVNERVATLPGGRFVHNLNGHGVVFKIAAG